MIDINELRRLAQAASHPTTKGRWIRLFGERTVYDRMEDGCRGIPVVSTDKHPPSPSEAACLDFIAAANPAAITEPLDRLEAAESECLEQARLNGMGSEREAALMAKLESAEGENTKLRKALTEKVISETMLRNLSLGNGSINASFEGGAVHLFVDAFATQLLEQFLESGATNYLEMSFHSNVTGPLVVTLQRVNGKTAHQLRAEAEKERDALRVELETERARLAACGVVALANTPDSAKRARDMRPEYWSASCGDVASLVDENIKLRAKIEAAEKSDAESIAMYRKARDERDELRGKVEAMEKQEPVAWRWELKAGQYTYVDKSDHAGKNARLTPLYARPGAKGE